MIERQENNRNALFPLRNVTSTRTNRLFEHVIPQRESEKSGKGMMHHSLRYYFVFYRQSYQPPELSFNASPSNFYYSCNIPSQNRMRTKR